MSEQIPDGINKSDVLAAIRDYDSGLAEKYRASTDYDLVSDGKKYPPVAIMCLAARRLVGRELIPRKEVRGGVGTKCFKVLERLNFQILPKYNKEFAFIVGYYLSKFNDTAYEALGFKTQKAAHEKIGKLLDLKPTYIKNRRDDYDPLHSWRRGWWQVELTPKKLRVIELF